VTSRHSRLHHLAHEVVVHHFLDVILCGGGVVQGHKQLNVKHDALGGLQLEIMDANAHWHRQTLEKQSPVTTQQGV